MCPHGAPSGSFLNRFAELASASMLITDPQKQYADVVIQVLPTQLIPDDNEGKVLRVRMIMKEGVKDFEPVYLYDEGSTISWIPCGRKLTCSYPGIKFFYGPDTYYGNEVPFQRRFRQRRLSVVRLAELCSRL